MSAPRAPSSLSNPAPAVDPADTDAISTIYQHLSQLRQAHSADNVPPLLDIELLVALADALLNAPADSARRSQLWTQLLHNVDAALTRALDRSRPLVSPDASDRCVLIPRDIKGWIENVVPIHVELIKNIVVEGRGKDAVLELLPLYQQLTNVKNVSPEDHANLYNLVLALDSVLKSEAQELPGDNSVIPPEENLQRLFGFTSHGELQHLCEASGIFDYSTDISEDMSQDDSDNRFILRGVYAAPPAPAAVPVQPSGASAAAAAASACLPVSRAPVPVAPGDGSADMSLVSDRTRSYMDDSNTSSESTSSAGTPAHSASYEGSMDMSIVPTSPAMRVGELNLSLDPTPPAATAPPSPGLRERTNMPMPPPSPRGRVATAKEDVNPHTPPTSGRVSPASRTGSRSGSGTRAARPSRGAVQPLMQSTPAGAGAHHSQRVPTFGRTASHGSDVSWSDYHGLSPQQPAMEKALAKEREERAREVQMWQALIEKEKEERQADIDKLKVLLQEKDDKFKLLLQEKDDKFKVLKEERATEVNLFKVLLQEKDERLREKDEQLREKDERRKFEAGMYQDRVKMLTERCEELKKKVEETSTAKPF